MTHLKSLLFAETTQGDARADVLLQLATLYGEEGAARREAGDTTAEDWTRQAISTLQQLQQDHPQYPHGDEATFGLALALTEIGEADAALAELTRLVRTWPQSARVPEAYVGIGDHYFANNGAYKALMAFQRASQFHGHPLRGYATNRLAWCYYNVGEYEKAIAAMREATALTAASAPTQPDLQGDSLDALVRFYADAGQVDVGAAWFEGRGDDARARAVRERIAVTWEEQGKFAQALDARRALLAAEPGGPGAAAQRAAIVVLHTRMSNRDEALAELGALRTKISAGQSAAGRTAHSNAETMLLRAIDAFVARWPDDATTPALRREAAVLVVGGRAPGDATARVLTVVADAPQDPASTRLAISLLDRLEGAGDVDALVAAARALRKLPGLGDKAFQRRLAVIERSSGR